MTATLQSIASTTSKLRALLQETRKDLERIQILQTTLSETLGGFFRPEPSGWGSLIQEESPAFDIVRDAKLWKETLSLLATGRVLGLAAQAEDVLAAGSGSISERVWLADGKAYARWIANGVTALSTSGEDSVLKAASQLIGKAVSIGYTDELVSTVTKSLVINEAKEELFYQIVAGLSTWEQRQILSSLLRFLDGFSAASLTSTSGSAKDSESNVVSASAALLLGVLKHVPALQDELLEQVLTRPVGILVVRASILALDAEHLKSLLERSWDYFGDKLHVKHKPIVAQESNAQILLLTAGKTHRTAPMDVFVLARSSNHGNAITERLSSSSPRVRWLGMVVGTAISRLVDKEGSRMDFDVEEMKTEEALRFHGLTHVDDTMGTVEDLIKLARVDGVAVRQVAKGKLAASKKPPKQKPAKTGIIEVVDDEDDLVPMAMPDSDPEDSEEDATLVNRKKPKVPVYIRDLVSGINDGDDYDRHLLALKTAPSLIRRKADFGSELKDRAEELASALVSLHDNFDMENWTDVRQQAMIALVVAQPRLVGPWLAKMLFIGDYSVSQRAAMLTAIGLGCRELAGYGQENMSLVKHQQEVSKPFPTKQLPDRLHKVYVEESAPMDVVARQLEQTMLRPVSTKQRPRTKFLRNDLASVVADCFFFPLTGHWQSFSQTTTDKRSPLCSPTILALLTKTLTIILAASGASSPALPQMKSELWTVLLSLRSRALQQAPLLEAVLFGFLTILDVSGRREMAERDGSALLETREWVALVWERLEGEGGRTSAGMAGIEIDVQQDTGESGSKDMERCRYLAAGILVKIKEILDEYQRFLVDNLTGI